MSSIALPSPAEQVRQSYLAKQEHNQLMFQRDPINYTSSYTFPNQQDDAHHLVDRFYQDATHNGGKLRFISLIKRTKVGMDGLMIELATQITTHSCESFCLDYNNVLFLTGMSNVAWERQLKGNMPDCFKDNIFHHGKLHSLKLNEKLDSLENGLIIIDEIDTGDIIDQQLHKTLNRHGLLNLDNLYVRNIRFVCVSATIKKQLSELERWEDGIHEFYRMTIPDSYVSHKDLLEMGIIQEFYPIRTTLDAEKWIDEDILQNYKNDYRVHIIRLSDTHSHCLLEAVKSYIEQVECLLFNSDDNLSPEEIEELFMKIKEKQKHCILLVKGFYRRATLIPNAYKLQIGAVMESFSLQPNVNIQIQGLPGRMTGYWRAELEAGHKTGPFRTSINAIKLYENWYNNPSLNMAKYKVRVEESLLNPEFFEGLTSYKPRPKPDHLYYESSITEFNILEGETKESFWLRVKKEQNLKFHRNPFNTKSLNEDGFAKSSFAKNTVETKTTLYQKLIKMKPTSGFNWQLIDMNTALINSNILQKRVYVCYESLEPEQITNPIILIRTLTKK